MHDTNPATSESAFSAELVATTRSFIDENFHLRIADLGQLAKIAGIAWPSFPSENVQQSAAAVAEKLAAFGFFDSVSILTADYAGANGETLTGAPAVVARKAGSPGYPHVLLYAHHDVQPPGDGSAWLSEPFIPELRGDRLYGRGVADDKSGIVTHLAAIGALIQLEHQQNIGLTVFIEGEEEAGSPSFDAFLAQYREQLQADVIVVADSGNWDLETPALTTSLRGLVSLVIEVQTLEHAVHSGMFGGPAPDAMTAMIRLLGTLHAPNGDVAIDGLKRARVQELDYPEARFRSELGLLEGVEVIGSDSILQSNWGGPAVTVIGIDYPSVAQSSNTLIPAVKAKVSVRLAPDEIPQQALEALKRHLEKHLPFGAKLTYHEVELGPGFFAPGGEVSNLAKASFAAAWGRPAVEIGVGGSIPFISKFQSTFPAAEILVTGVEDPDSRAHSPNESQHLPTLKRAMVAEALLLRKLNQQKGV